MSLPKQCLYTNKINSSHARNFQSAIAPQNGTEYNAGETIILCHYQNNVYTQTKLIQVMRETFNLQLLLKMVQSII